MHEQDANSYWDLESVWNTFILYVNLKCDSIKNKLD